SCRALSGCIDDRAIIYLENCLSFISFRPTAQGPPLRSKRASQAVLVQSCELGRGLNPWILPQLHGRLDVELKARSLLTDDDAIVAPGGFERNVSGTDVGEYTFWVAFEGIPETTATADFDQEAVAGFKGDVSRSFSGRKLLRRAVFAKDAEAVGQCV